MKNFTSQVREISRLIFEKDLSEGPSGNISFFAEASAKRAVKRVKLPLKLKRMKGESIAITTSGSRIYELMENPADFLSVVRVSDDGGELEILDGRKPSSEILCHILCYEAVEETLAVLHVHPKYSLALAAGMTKAGLNRALSKTHTEFKYYFPNGIGLVERTEPGTLRLAERNMKETLNHNAVLWKNHGLISRGRDLYGCYDALETVESISKIALLSGKSLKS